MFHDFHNTWVVLIKNALNRGLLPPDCYAQVEQHLNRFEGDVLTLARLDSSNGNGTPLPPASPPGPGAVAAAEAPPKTELHLSGPKFRRRLVAVRHVSNHRIVALIEVVSPSKKDRAESVVEFANKIETALDNRIHVAILDLLPIGRHDSSGMAAAVWDDVGGTGYERPADKPLTFAAFVAPARTGLYADHRAAGDPLPETRCF